MMRANKFGAVISGIALLAISSPLLAQEHVSEPGPLATKEGVAPEVVAYDLSDLADLELPSAEEPDEITEPGMLFIPPSMEGLLVADDQEVELNMPGQILTFGF